MLIERISDPRDPRVAEYRDIPDAELVRSRRLFVAEGRAVVRRLIAGGRYAIRSLLLNEAAFRALEPSLAQIARTEPVPIYLCGAGDFPIITGFNIHRGCLALVHRPEPASAADLLGDASRIVVLEGVANADNVGGVFRNAAAFGADAVLLSPTCCDPLYRKAIRTSMAATLRVPFARLDDWPAGLAVMRERGFEIVALTPNEPAEDLDAFAARQVASNKIALLVGAEGQGLTPQAERAAARRVRISISDQMDSLNLAVASGIALHRLYSPARGSDSR
jgi:tRNA G18 (ribose-2'-O)-methylase SpoU